MKRNIIAGLIFLACTLSSTVAFSQVPNQNDIDGAKKRCLSEHSGSSSQNTTLRAMCLQSIDIYVLNKKQDAGDKSVASAITGLQGKLDRKFEAQNNELKVLIKTTVASAMKSFGDVKPTAESQVKKDKVPVQNRDTTVSPPVPQKQAPRLGSSVPYQVVRAAGSSFAATTYPAGMRSFIQFAYLSSKARNLFRDEIPFRVLVLKNGVPLSVAGPLGVNQSFYADLDKDGKPDPEPYHGVNPAFSDDVYVGFLPGDNIRLVFLRETGYYIRILGLPEQTLWGDAINVQYFLPKHAGGWKILAVEGLREY